MAVADKMRVAIVSDIHGNRRAFEAVLADLRQVAPDLAVQGGDLAYGGTHSADIIDQIRALGWPGVRGNTDEMLWAPKGLAEFAAATPKPGAPSLRVCFTQGWVFGLGSKNRIPERTTLASRFRRAPLYPSTPHR